MPPVTFDFIDDEAFIDAREFALLSLDERIREGFLDEAHGRRMYEQLAAMGKQEFYTWVGILGVEFMSVVMSGMADADITITVSSATGLRRAHD